MLALKIALLAMLALEMGMNLPSVLSGERPDNIIYLAVGVLFAIGGIYNVGNEIVAKFKT